MKDVIKIALGILIALLFFAMVGLVVIAYSTPTTYEKCYALCVLKQRDQILSTCITTKECAAWLSDANIGEHCATDCKPLQRTGLPLLVQTLKRITYGLAP